MKSGFIFGAGASKLAGAPLMNNFLDQAQDLLRLKTEGIVESEKEFNDVFNAIAELQGIHSKAFLDLDNIEILFGAIEMGLLLKKLGERDEESIKTLHASLITLIYKTLENSIKFPVVSGHITPPKPYGAFFTLLKSILDNQPGQDPNKFTLITFNYDLCIDFSLFKNRIQYDYCLEPNQIPQGIPLLKLHGSINWGKAGNDKIAPFNISGAQFGPLYDQGHVIYDLGTQLTNGFFTKPFLSGPPIIVPPTWNKNSYHSQLSNVWSQAALEFSQAENIFIIGYSLPETDSFFRYLYALGSESATRLRNFVVINPDNSGKTESRFRELIGKGIENRFRYVDKTFEDGLGVIRDVLRNP